MCPVQNLDAHHGTAKRIKRQMERAENSTITKRLNEILGQQPASSPVKVVESMNRRRRLPNIDDDASDSADDSLQEGADNT